MGILDSNIDWDNVDENQQGDYCLLYTSPSPRDP